MVPGNIYEEMQMLSVDFEYTANGRYKEAGGRDSGGADGRSQEGQRCGW